MNITNGEIKFTNIQGKTRDTALSTENLPDVILTERPIELQFVAYNGYGHGHRYSISHNWQLEFDFNITTTSPDIMSKLHNHDYWEILIVDAVPMEMQIESSIYELRTGDICILNRATRHSEHFQPGQTIIYLTLSAAYISSWPQAANITFKKPISQLFKNGISLPNYQNRDYIIARPKNKTAYASVSHLIELLKDELLEDLPGSRYFVRGLIYRLISTFTDSKVYDAVYRDIGAEDNSSLAIYTKQLLDKNKHHTTLSELEIELQYNGAYINRLFKRKYGCSILEYNQNICLQRIADLLLTSNITIEEICHMIGFTNRTHIYKLFKEKYGCTPSEFRKRR